MLILAYIQVQYLVSEKSATKKPTPAAQRQATSLSRKPGQQSTIENNASASSGVSPVQSITTNKVSPSPAGNPATAPGGTVYQKKLQQRQEAIGIKETVR